MENIEQDFLSMIRLLTVTLILFFTFPSSLSQEPCGPERSLANEALEAAMLQMETGDSEQAIEDAKRAVRLAETCFNAHLTLSQAYFLRFDHVSGLEALGVSRAFRKQIRTVRAMRPDHVGARRMEISYLYLAPRIAGGNRSKAELLIEELESIDSAEAYYTRLDIGSSAETDEDTIVALLDERRISSADELEDRMILVRRLIGEAKRYRAADKELASWDAITLSEETVVERLFLRGALRVMGAFEYEDAEVSLTAFVDRRSALPQDAMESVAVGYSFLGDARRKQGNRQGAREAYEAALAVNPESSRANSGLAALN